MDFAFGRKHESRKYTKKELTELIGRSDAIIREARGRWTMAW
jgi:hypothetical protein